MKSRVADIRTHVLEAPLSAPFGWSFNRTEKRTGLLIEIEGEDGTVGWGECYGPPGPVAAGVEALSALVVGEDALATDWIWECCYNQFRDHGQRGTLVQALSGIDIALWDLKGKLLGQPVHRLMGGALRDRVRAYATGLYRREDPQAGDPSEYLAEEAAAYLREGFGAVKLKVGFGVQRDLRNVSAVRQAIGPDTELMIDANHGYDVIDAIRLGRALEPFAIAWFEEPVVPEDVAGYAELRRVQPVPVAGGECSFTRWDFKHLFEMRALDYAQPDTCAAGGLSEAKKIADMAAVHGVRYVPHVWGTGIAIAAALQLLSVLPHNPLRFDPWQPPLEFDRTEHAIRQAILTRPIEHEGGYVRVPDGPGLGIDVDRAAVERFRVG